MVEAAQIVFQILQESLGYFLQVWYWIVLGFVLAGFVEEFAPKEWFAKKLGGRGIKSVLRGSVLGVLTDVCSHGVLPLGVSLFHMGASRASVISFIVSTPWIGVMETMILLSFLGWQMTAIVAGLSIVMAIISGLIIGQLEKRKIIETGKAKGTVKQKYCCAPHHHKKTGKFAGRIRSALHYSYDLFKMIGKWFVIGFVGAGVVKVLISEQLIKAWLGYAVYSVPLALGISSLIEVCSEGTVPIVGSLFAAGASPGVVFALLMGGVATDLTEIGTIWTVLGKKTAIATLLILVAQTLLFGFLINLAM